MKELIKLSTLFVVGSLLGYIIEVIYKRVISKKKWTNPGFLKGPYLPIYGFGTIVLYEISSILINLLNVPKPLEVIIVILTFGVLLTFLELLSGFIFLKRFNLRLWDYSKRRLNLNGLICLRYSVYWTILGVGYFYLLHPLFISLTNFSISNQYVSLIVAMIMICILIDTFISFNIPKKITKVVSVIKNNIL
ncbi:MAG: putative ABC transporter permease [Bacilli bacterium]|nr:putative ABC transporter permease [Bacilli bacterium]